MRQHDSKRCGYTLQTQLVSRESENLFNPGSAKHSLYNVSDISTSGIDTKGR